MNLEKRSDQNMIRFFRVELTLIEQGEYQAVRKKVRQKLRRLGFITMKHGYCTTHYTITPKAERLLREVKE